MKKFDKIFGNIMAAIIILIVAWAFVHQIISLALGDLHSAGGLYGNRGDVLMYETE